VKDGQGMIERERKRATQWERFLHHSTSNPTFLLHPAMFYSSWTIEPETNTPKSYMPQNCDTDFIQYKYCISHDRCWLHMSTHIMHTLGQHLNWCIVLLTSYLHVVKKTQQKISNTCFPDISPLSPACTQSLHTYWNMHPDQSFRCLFRENAT